MKIAVFSISYPPVVSGVSAIASDLAQFMAKKHQVHVFTANTKFKAETVSHPHLTEHRLPAVKFPLRKNVFAPTPRIIQILQLLDQIHPDIIHIHDPSYLGSLAAIASFQHQIPILATHHFIPAFITSYFEHVLKSPRLLKAVEKQIWKSVVKLYNQLDHIVVPTHTIKTTLQQQPINPPISVISNGINLNLFFPPSSTPASPPPILHRLRLQPQQYLLYVGRLDKDKNLPTLIQAFSLLKSSPPLPLVLVGEGQQKANLIALAKKLRLRHLCRFPGYIPETKLAPLYQHASAFIITSTIESQSISTLQAMACGLPVIAARAAALPELISHQKNGLLVPPHNPQSISQAITYLLNRPQKAARFGRLNHQLASHHDRQHTFKQYHRLYQQLIKNS